MAAFCYSEGGAYRKTMAGGLEHMEFVLDSADEVAGLPTNTEAKAVGGEMIGPCAPGSVALVPSTKGFYMLDSSGTWAEM